MYLSIEKFVGCLLHENWSLWLHMYVVCYFGEHMSCRSINIYCALCIEQTTNKSCQKISFFCKKQQKPACFAVNRRFRAISRRFFTGKPVRIQIDLNWSNWSVFTGFHR
jgi:hypothetical protein